MGFHGHVWKGKEGGKDVVRKTFTTEREAQESHRLLTLLRLHEFASPEPYETISRTLIMQDMGDLKDFADSVESASNRLELLLKAAQRLGQLHRMELKEWDALHAFQLRFKGDKGELINADVAGLVKAGGMGWDDSLYCLSSYAKDDREFNQVLDAYLENAPENRKEVEKIRQTGLQKIKEDIDNIKIRMTYN